MEFKFPWTQRSSSWADSIEQVEGSSRDGLWFFKQIHIPNPVNSITFYISYRTVNSTALKRVNSFYLQNVYLRYNANLPTGFYLICLLASSNFPFDNLAIKKSGASASCRPVEIYFLLFNQLWEYFKMYSWKINRGFSLIGCQVPDFISHLLCSFVPNFKTKPWENDLSVPITVYILGIIHLDLVYYLMCSNYVTGTVVGRENNENQKTSPVWPGELIDHSCSWPILNTEKIICSIISVLESQWVKEISIQHKSKK